MAKEELKWQNIDADDLPAAVKKSFDAMVEAEAAFKADLERLLKHEGHRPYRLLESGNRPSVDVGDGTEARLALEAMVDSAGLRNIVLALARFTSDRSEKLKQQDPATAACWLRV
jgi:hypothetical protein